MKCEAVNRANGAICALEATHVCGVHRTCDHETVARHFCLEHAEYFVNREWVCVPCWEESRRITVTRLTEPVRLKVATP